MSPFGDSDFSNEMASGIAVASSVFVDDGARFYDNVSGPPVKRPWYKRRFVLYTVTTFLVLAVVALAAVAVGGGLGVGNKGGDSRIPAGGTTTSEGGNQGVTGVTSTPPTFAPNAPTTAPPTTAPPTAPPTLSPTAPPQAIERTNPLAFYVMGDVPYASAEEQVLRDQITAMNINRHPGASFLVHVGDFQRGLQTECALGFYTSVRNMLSLVPVPTFVLAGDNDILDCPNSKTAWDRYQDHFVDFEQEWALQQRQERAPHLDVSNVERNASNSELFSFIEDRILFLSVNLMNMPPGEDTDDAFDARLATSKAWVTHQLAEKFHQNAIRGVVMFGHALVSGDVSSFFEDIVNVFVDAQVLVPVLYMHGDGHRFLINNSVGQSNNWEYLTAIQVEQGGRADPLLVTVAMVKNGTMEPLVAENDMQTVVGDGLFLIDRQGGCFDEDYC